MKERLTIQAFLEKYKGKYVMHCDTEDKVNRFLGLLHNTNRKCCNGESYKKENRWEQRREETCYNFNKGYYSSVDFYKKDNYTVLEFDDFEFINNKEGKNMKNIEIELYRRGKTVYGWCNYLKEDLRNKGILYMLENKFELYSFILPSLEDKMLYVRGENKNQDERGFMYTYKSVEEAIKICNNIKECVNKINEEQPKENFEIERVI